MRLTDRQWWQGLDGGNVWTPPRQDQGWALQGSEVGERIAVNYQQVGAVASVESARCGGEADRVGGRDSGHFQDLVRGKALLVDVQRHVVTGWDVADQLAERSFRYRKLRRAVRLQLPERACRPRPRQRSRVCS